jgi:diaminohydroxyphosphoribosylaminopyrimidine deaminase/5-amino-6-(5-phosphoribosylamino)uracil reductase
MTEALHLAGKGRGKTYPNPAVGAVLVRDRRIAGIGFHRRWGLPHAEVEAIRSAGRLAKGSDLYVTLEPCCHYGKTPPCTDAIIASGIRRVFVATRDPNPRVKGRGIRALRDAGLEVAVGLLAKSARRLNETYFKYMKHGRPFVTLKIAQTIDGRIATHDGRSKWITSARARKKARSMRAEAQAILVGLNTVIKDDPMLLPDPGRDSYARCVLDTDLSISPASRLVRSARRYSTIIYCGTTHAGRIGRLEKMGVVVKRVRCLRSGLLDIDQIIDDLASMQVMHLFVEGGSTVFTSFLRTGAVDKIAVFTAPKIMGDDGNRGSFINLGVKDPEKCYGFRMDSIERVGTDLLTTLYPARA